MNIKAIFLDADGTLLDFKRAETEALTRLNDFMSTGYNSEEFIQSYHKINRKMWVELEEGTVTAEGLKLERFRRFASLMNSSLEAQQLSDFYLKALGEGSYYLEGAQELLKTLAGRYPLVMITNGLSQVQRARFKALDYGSIFKKILISEEEGTAKPDPEMYRRGAEAIGIPLNREILMVGDSLTSDIAGGIAAGVSTCWFNPEGWKNESPFRADFEIRELMDLMDVLES